MNAPKNFWQYGSAITIDREAQDAIHKKELEEITTLLEQLALVFKESESRPTMNAHEFINHELEFDLNNPYTYHPRRKL